MRYRASKRVSERYRSRRQYRPLIEDLETDSPTESEIAEAVLGSLPRFGLNEQSIKNNLQKFEYWNSTRHITPNIAPVIKHLKGLISEVEAKVEDYLEGACTAVRRGGDIPHSLSWRELNEYFKESFEDDFVGDSYQKGETLANIMFAEPVATNNPYYEDKVRIVNKTTERKEEVKLNRLIPWFVDNILTDPLQPEN